MRRAIFVFVLLVSVPLRANIGESVADCVKRYGKPMGFSEASPAMPFGTLVFTAGGYQLIIYLVGDAEVGARVAKTDKTAFSPAEMKTILDAEAVPGSPWIPTTSDDPSCLQWNRADKVTALYEKEKHLMIFTSPKMAEANRAAVKATPANVAPPANTALPPPTSLPAAPAPPGTSP